MSSSQQHWENVYKTRRTDDVSWFQARPETSLDLIESLAVNRGDRIIDVGGGASTLVDELLKEGFSSLSVLDISATALTHARKRLKTRAKNVNWIDTDVLGFSPIQPYAVWHDRAVFHFLTDKMDQKRYVETLKRSTVKGSFVLIATFALDGPKKCSGLLVERYDNKKIARVLGKNFEMLESRLETHITPAKAEQRFIYFVFKRV